MDELVATSGAIEAIFLPDAGGRLHRLRAFGHELLRTPDDVETHLADPFFWGAYVLAPWANRIDPVPTEVAGRVVRPEPNFNDGSAIHGQVYARRWQRDGDGLRIDAGGDEEWPWHYGVSLRPTVEGSVLHIELELVNRSDAAMPAGLGLHPWWRRPVEVAVRAASVYPTTTDSPSVPEPVSGRFDRRTGGSLPAGLDAAWTDLDDPPVELRWPDVGIRLTIRAVGPGLHVVAASPDNLDAAAVELQTHAPQGLRRLVNGERGALALLEPGNRLRLGIELSFDRIDT